MGRDGRPGETMESSSSQGSCCRGGESDGGCGAGDRSRVRRVARRVEGLAYRLLREPLFVALVVFRRFATRRDRE